MGFIKNLAIGSLVTLFSFGGSVRGAMFNPLFDETNPYVTLEGRKAFYDGKGYSRWMEEGQDELGFFVGDTCIGSTLDVSNTWVSHYDGLKMNNYFYDQIVSGDLNVSAKAYNSDTGTIWDADIRGYRFNDCAIDVQAVQNTQIIPEPATVALLGMGALTLISGRKRKSIESKVVDKK